MMNKNATANPVQLTTMEQVALNSGLAAVQRAQAVLGQVVKDVFAARRLPEKTVLQPISAERGLYAFLTPEGEDAYAAAEKERGIDAEAEAAAEEEEAEARAEEGA